MIIDVHTHTAGQDKNIIKYVKKFGVDFSLTGCLKEMKKSGVSKIVTIGGAINDLTPICFKKLREQCRKNKNLVASLGINPKNINKKSLGLIVQGAKEGWVKGVKILLGYYHYYAYDKIYTPVYKLAEKHNLVVTFHTGDVLFSGKVRYAHPLAIDDVAVDFPKVKFVIAHIGNPWFMDAAEVAYKNKNVWIDTSGLVIGNGVDSDNSFIKKRFQEAYDYVDNPKKFLYGSDWPLVPMKKYISLIKSFIPKKDYAYVFYKNAIEVYRF